MLSKPNTYFQRVQPAEVNLRIPETEFRSGIFAQMDRFLNLNEKM